MGKARDDISFDSQVDSGVHFKLYTELRKTAGKLSETCKKKHHILYFDLTVLINLNGQGLHHWQMFK